MANLIEQLRLWVEQVIVTLGYPGIVFMVLLENIFPPLPSTLIMPFAGFLVSQGRFSFAGIVASGTLGALLGALILYYLGRWADEAVVRRFSRLLGVSEPDLDRTLQVFDRYGVAMVFFGRCFPLIRSLISIPAGMRRMPLTTFLIFSALGSAIWNSLLGYGGMLLGERWPILLGWINQYDQIVLIVMIGGALMGVAYWLLVSRTRRNGQSDGVR